MRAIRPRGRRGVPLPRRARHRLGVVRERVVGAGGQRDANDAPVGPADHAHDAGVPDRRLLDASQPQCLPPGGEGSANLLRWHAQAKDIAVDPAEPADCPGDGGQVGVGVEDVGQDAQCLALPAPAVGLCDQRRTRRQGMGRWFGTSHGSAPLCSPGVVSGRLCSTAAPPWGVTGGSNHSSQLMNLLSFKLRRMARVKPALTSY
jgi:hypothetical protein